MPRPIRLLPLLVLLFLTGCVTTPSTVSDRLFFGRSLPQGGVVTDAQWDAFVAEVIVPRFPDGFTVWQGAGHWRGENGADVSEASTVLEVVHVSDPKADAKLDEIARIYRERFNQEAVMRVRSPAELTFSRR